MRLTVTTYFGVKGIKKVSVPSVAILVLVGLYAIYSNVDQAGGGAAFLALSKDTASQSPITFVTAVNLVVGSWIVGAGVMAEYTRFAKKACVALAIPFIVMIIAQWFLQIVGALGGVVSGSADFTTYLLQQGMIIGGIGAFFAYGVTYGVLDLPDILIPSLLDLVVSMICYAVIYAAASLLNIRVGYAAVASVSTAAEYG
jgi:purine-cytosine permease-like protein